MGMQNLLQEESKQDILTWLKRVEGTKVTDTIHSYNSHIVNYNNRNKLVAKLIIDNHHQK